MEQCCEGDKVTDVVKYVSAEQIMRIPRIGREDVSIILEVDDLVKYDLSVDADGERRLEAADVDGGTEGVVELEQLWIVVVQKV